MNTTDKLEKRLDDLFIKKAPPMPANSRRVIVKYAPWASLILGVLSLYAAFALWQWAHVPSGLLDYANSLCNIYTQYSCTNYSAGRLSLWVWISIVIVAVEGILYLLAFSGLRAHWKQGWDFLFWGALISIAYAVVSLLAGYNDIVGFIVSLLSTVIGLWVLFQIRGSYAEDHRSINKTR